MRVVSKSMSDAEQLMAETSSRRLDVSDKDGFDVRAVLSTLWRRKWHLVGFVGLMMVPIAALVVNLPSKYTATATVLVDPKQILSVASNPVVNAVSADEISLQTEIEVLRSAHIAQSVIQKENLTNDPEFNSEESDIVLALKVSIDNIVAYVIPTSPNAEAFASQVKVTIDNVIAYMFPTSPNAEAFASQVKVTIDNIVAYMFPASSNGEALASQGDVTSQPSRREPVIRQEGSTSALSKPLEGRIADTLEHYYKRLSVVQSGKSRAILVSFTAHDPEKAATIVNAVVDSYVERQFDGKVSSSNRANVWLNDRVDRLRVQVLHADQAVEDYRIANNLSEIRGQEGLDAKALTQLQNDLIAVRADLTAKEGKLKRITALVASESEDFVLSELDATPLMVELRQAEAELSRREAQLLKEFGPNHPIMLDIEAQHIGLTEKLRREARKIAENVAFETDIARQRESSIRARIAEIEDKINKAARASIQMRELERDAQAKRSVYKSLLSRREELQEQQELIESDVAVITRATTPLEPSFPNLPIFLVAGLVGTSCISLALVALLEHLDRTLRKSWQLEELTGIPVLATIPKLRRPRNAKDLYRFVLDEPLSMYAEAVKAAALAIDASDEPDHKAILITSSRPGEGKTTFALSLAASLARSGAKTVIVDMDLRLPSVGRQVDQDAAGTLNDVLESETRIEDVLIEHVDESNLHIITCELGNRSPSDIYRSERFKEIWAELKRTYQHVIFDCPPIVGFPETQIAAQIADKIILVVEWGKTTDRFVWNGMRVLHQHRSKIVGSVMTQVDLRQYAQYEYQDFGNYYDTYQKYYKE